MARYIILAVTILMGALISPIHGFAASNEIKVQTDDLTPIGGRELEIHTNYTDGRKIADYPGEIAPHHVLRITPEYSFGLAQNWDVGIYLPLSFAPSGSLFLDGTMGRIKYLRREGEKENSLFYGVNFEVSYLQKRITENYGGVEAKGIVGVRRGPWLGSFNLILARQVTGTGSSSPEYGIAIKALREIKEDFSFGVEHYAGLGRLNQNLTWNETSHITYAVVEFEGNHIEYSLGIGHGWTQASDRSVVKFVIGIPFE